MRKIEDIKDFVKHGNFYEELPLKLLYLIAQIKSREFFVKRMFYGILRLA